MTWLDETRDRLYASGEQAITVHLDLLHQECDAAAAAVLDLEGMVLAYRPDGGDWRPRGA